MFFSLHSTEQFFIRGFLQTFVSGEEVNFVVVCSGFATLETNFHTIYTVLSCSGRKIAIRDMKKWTWTLETWQTDIINRSTRGIGALTNHTTHRHTHVICSAGRFHKSAILHLMTLWHEFKTLARRNNVHSVLCDGIDGRFALCLFSRTVCDSFNRLHTNVDEFPVK